MATENWGACMDCEWWQIEPRAAVAEETVGRCIEEELQPFQLLVTGNSGCNHFEEGKPSHQKGASERPPVAEPQ